VKRYSRETRETCEKSGTGEMGEWRVTSERSESRVTCETDEGTRSEVRGFRNFVPRTSSRAFPASLARLAKRLEK
jgi:hypothetical protein